MNPNEYIVTTPELNGSVLYYPGSGTDSGPVKLFGGNTELSTVIYCDYELNQDDAHRFVCNIEGFVAGPINELRPADFDARDWNAFWPKNPSATRHHNSRTAFGIKTTLSNKCERKFDFIFLGTEEVQTYAILLHAGIYPNIVVLQDHGSGGNWTSFGAGGELEKIAIRHGRVDGIMPDFLFVAEGATQPWDGYQQVSDFALYKGQWHSYKRAIFRRS